MFRVSYIDRNGKIAHKGGFDSDASAYKWVNAQGNNIIPLKLLVWSEDIQCFDTFKKF